jgi:hypothetical protein
VRLQGMHHIKCWRDARAGGLQVWASIAETYSTLTVAYYSTEWFNNSGQAAQSVRHRYSAPRRSSTTPCC